MASINFNQSAMVALDTLRNINTNLQKVQNQISTGKEVSNARDNAAVWSISKTMESDVESFKAVQDNLKLGGSTVGVARGASEKITDLLKQMKTLVVSAQEENVDRNKIQRDVDSLREQIGSIVDAAQFNGLNLLKEGNSVKLLASLDRSEAGVVTARDILVDRIDLTETAGTTTAALSATDAGAVDIDAGAFSGIDDATVAAATPATPTSGTVTLNATAVTGGEAADELTYTIKVGTKTINVNFALDSSDADIATDGAATAVEIGKKINDALQASGVLPDGVTAAYNSTTGEITISNASETPLQVTVTDQFTDDSAATTTAIANAAAGNIAVATTDAGALGGTANADVENLAAATPAFSTVGTQTLTFQTGDVEAGTLFRLSIDGSSVEYRSIAGDTGSSVAEKLRDRATAIAPDSFELSVADNVITFTNKSGNAIGIEARADNGEAGGALEDLKNLKVTTSDAASSALRDIENMMDSIIDAASSFGSAQKRIGIQNDFIQSLVDNMSAGISALTDASLEEASARLQSLQVQQQLNIQALTIANQSPQAILALFR